MDISLSAKLKSYEEFISNFKEGDEKITYNGKSLLFYSLSNNDTRNRYLISMFLLEKGMKTDEINECGETLLHVLLSRTKHDLVQTEELSKIIISRGVNINQLDEKGRVSFQYLINMKYTDEELEPLYQLWFSCGNILINHKNAWGKTPLEIAEQMPYRNKIVERMKKYV